ncbi:Dynamin-like GTPase that mediates homotypic ER fusion [Blastomyces dermatitidis]|uniref:Protein SEY1 n=3 Tax=Blastomyces TaxID=229219 RepID=SEY1_BLAGS|nr:protein SEY1 [Blastomyces gilchristii SLH14081]XP_045277063.1 protein SEY1 [Blastomyces dermatitidis ER-3]C5GMK3.1 RecName: Full=Protein SEY1 [Blastomyces dermatitidis ER-3]C5K3E1.1 RecName: Full=Protein SEY1 [Blastomyces gilchristii SLH14081]EGE80673.1 protein SEY1 [Blastomyces dermatitidis ATCC 18188]EQL29468.1 protein SEY1 [Blastomyces dermatitidis ATCC 26199]EEQ90308.1 protein SEY1 [Blastomyces dermatitidis ER-3]OAT14270.1 protein SEY1 [Blastomyces gilchristii SLH14081]
MVANGHFASNGEGQDSGSYEHGVQVIDEDKEFNPNVSRYLTYENVTPAGFNYHLISVFGSQSTGKSTLLNHLFGTHFSVMSETERRQTTKGIWLSKNKRVESSKDRDPQMKMADNILVMDVEGTDGRERGEDQDFERKSALFALATSEVLIVNIWEHQVGLYQGANMGLLKTVFEVNLELFLKDNKSTPRSLLFFVIRDFVGTTPLQNLQNTLLQDLNRIWSSLSKPAGLENSTINDYFDFAFAGLPHKNFQPEKFVDEVQKLSTRFRNAHRDPNNVDSRGTGSIEGGIFLPEYHRRIPADGFAVYAEGVWDQIVNNKDLDLPTQQELLAQFRCDEISREALVAFDEAISPFESKQAEAVQAGSPQVLGGLGPVMRNARMNAVKNFDAEASRYHKRVYQMKKSELEEKIDTRLKALFLGQLNAAHRSGVQDFSESVSAAVKAGQKRGASYDFAEIVSRERQLAIEKFEKEARSTLVEDAPWSNYQQELSLYQKDLERISGQLRRDEMRRLATRVERWVRSRLGESVDLEFNALGSGRGGSGAPEFGDKPSENTIWDRVWTIFVDTVLDAERRFTERASSFDASLDEVDVGLWRLRRKSWGVLRAKIEEEVMEGNLLLKLRENFEDKFRYDDAGVPRIWRPTDDIESVYTQARESTLTLIPLLARFRLAETNAPPPLDKWIGHTPSSATPADEEDLTPIGGVDEDEGKSLEEEMTMIGEAKKQDLIVRFKKTADGVYVEAKRSAIGGITQVPLYFYGLLLALGWNEIMAVLRNPAYFFLLFVCAIGAYVTYQLNLWGPIIKMTEAASHQALEEGKRRLRDFLEASDTGRQAMAMSGARNATEEHEMSNLNRKSGERGGQKYRGEDVADDDDVDDDF